MTFSFDKVPAPDNWAVAIFCILLLLLALEFSAYRRKVSLLGKALFSQRHFSLLIREGKVADEFFAFMLLVFDLAVYAFGLLFIFQKFHPSLVSRMTLPGTWGVLCLGLLILFGAKRLCNRIYAALYGREKEIESFHLYKLAFLTDTALVLFPLLIVVAFTCRFAYLYGFIPVFSLLALVWLFKLLKINPRNINLFHFFIYFCTLEILPYVVLAKLIAMV